MLFLSFFPPYMLPSFVGMLPVLLLAGLILALSIPGTVSESATLRFLGQTEFVVNESSTAVVRLVVERVGDPVNVTALVLVRHKTSSSSITHCASILIKLSNHLFCLYLMTLLCCWALCPVKERISDLFWQWPVCRRASAETVLEITGCVLAGWAGHAVKCGWGVSHAFWYF